MVQKYMYFLYVKTHMKTGLKYLGYTKRDPYKYKGSGKRWLNHLNFHGNDVWTNIIFKTEIKEEILTEGIKYSKLWNIVASKEWANLIIEQGDGGDTSKYIDFKKRNNKKTSERIKKLNASPSNPFKNSDFQKELRKRMVAKSKSCIHCGRIIDPANYSRHIKKCEKVIQREQLENASCPDGVPIFPPSTILRLRKPELEDASQ